MSAKKKDRRGDYKNVGLLVETSNSYARGILRGVREFLSKKLDWSIFLAEHSRHETHLSLPESWDGDGVIARIETETTANLVKKLKIPAVDVSAARLVPGIPWVETDDESIANMAIDHLTGCGLRNLAFFGDPTYNWSKWRCEFFQIICEQRKFRYHIYNLPERTTPQVEWQTERKQINGWLHGLPKPVGIFACYDACGHQLLEVCRHFGLSVPDEVAIIGVDDDDLLCELSYPPLTSIALDAYKTGYIAASLLDRMMAGEKLKEQKHAVKPIGVKKRASTDIVAVRDPYVSQVVAYIRENYKNKIDVEDLLMTVPLSRRGLETRFRQSLNRTLHDEIVRVRIEHIKKRLTDTNEKLSAIADEMGFTHPEYLSVFFKKQTGITPREYRNQTSRLSKIKFDALVKGGKSLEVGTPL